MSHVNPVNPANPVRDSGHCANPVRVTLLLGLLLIPSTVGRAADAQLPVDPAAPPAKGDLSRPAGGKLMTRWAKDVSPDKVHAEYPRPQLVRKRWQNLNGLWNYTICPRSESGFAVSKWDGQILVPFPVESELSGVRRSVGSDRQLVCERSFQVPADWLDQRILLNFGAVDWEARVFVNGQEVGVHQGGYDPFSFDITEALSQRPAGQVEHQLRVVVWDPTDAGTQPRGKQVSKPEGIWYTPVTGIWQTVWLEPVPPAHIDRLNITPQFDDGKLQIEATVNKANAREKASQPRWTWRVSANGGKWKAEGDLGSRLTLSTDGFEPWSPANPKLYDLVVELLEGKAIRDRVESYFGMRKIALGKDLNGQTRILLNGEPVFQFGPLDQGWWPDGLYTAPSDEALLYDLEMTRKFGFNLVRKHVKVEPARWYYHCDRLGLLVWQDMPSGDANARWPLDGTENKRTPEADQQYGRELKALIDARRNDTCIVAWVPFNEAWGQFDTVRWTKWVKDYDPSRLVISASGGNDFGVGDIRDIHFYPQPEFPPAESHRAAVLGEYGGLGLPLAGHTWLGEKNWGYRQFKTKEELQETYLKYIATLRPMVESHLSAAIYTQTTDVEIEVNGLMTYDREITKLEPAVVAAAHQALYAPLRKLSPREVIESSVIAHWRFEEGKPGELVPHDRQKQEGVAARDVSGHRNHLYAYGEGNAPKSSADVPAASIPSLGRENRGSLDDTASGNGATRDLYTDPGRSRTHMDAINTFPFTDFTLEASFQFASTGSEQTLVGEDGKPTAADAAPLQLLVRDDGRVAVEAIDRIGALRTVSSRQPVPVGQWRHAAVIGGGGKLRLLLNAGKGYELEGEADFETGLILNDGTWTVGRGFHAGRISRDARALIDEVRVSTKALPVEALLWSKTATP